MSYIVQGDTGDWEVVIGLEVHAQVASKAKLFSGSPTAFGAEPNSQVSLVDAAMRQLLATGWMHNRVRMIVASFLIKDLLIDWQSGAEWFWDTLVDADLASNAASWQWVAGCGADAAPYFRIFNPTIQGAKFDPDGSYVRRWVPEVSRLPDRLIHAPWTAKPIELADAGIELGKDYPAPIIDHSMARNRALEKYKLLKAGKNDD